MGRCAGAFGDDGIEVERPGGANDMVKIGSQPSSSLGELEERKHLTMGRSTATLQAAPRAAKVETRPQTREGHRDTVEAIVVAFILALVVQGFRGPGFRDSDGFDGSDPDGPAQGDRLSAVWIRLCRQRIGGSRDCGRRLTAVYSGLCVNCRYQALHLDAEPSFKGDRILVMMFPYDLPFLPGSGPPERWDVVVFRYPEEPEVSYIKRLVGLPGETIRIYHGDVFVKSRGERQIHAGPQADAPSSGDADQRLRRPPSASGPCAARPSGSAGAASRPAGSSSIPTSSRYQSEGGPEGRVGRAAVSASRPRSRAMGRDPGRPTLPRAPRATLITDFYSYNTNMSADYSNLLDDVQREQEGAWMQPHWVGDLTLEANLEITSVAADASVRLELVKAGLPHRCTIDLGPGPPS